ncbi:MAG: phosphoribosylamine--glycine ligase [Candidatus Jorgensenbacteria bacterium]
MKKRRKFLFVSKDSLSGDLALKLVEEGHEVKFYFKDPKSKDVYDGFFEKVKNWRHHVSWADVIIFDDSNYGESAQALRKAGKRVIGGSRYTDKLEIKREFGQDELRKFGINTLPSREFNDYKAAISFIKRTPRRYVFKPSGKEQSYNKRLVIISEEDDASDLLDFLRHNKKTLRKKIPRFLIQEFVAGIEIAVGAFFNGEKFIHPINVNFEHKRIFTGNLGPMTGEAGTMMFWENSNKIFESTLEKMTPVLQKSGYIGYIDLNCIVNKNDIYPLEFTARFGYPTIQIQLEGILDNAGDWLYRLACGRNFTLRTKEGFQIGVVIFTPPALSEGNDMETAETYRDIAIRFEKEDREGVHIGDVRNDNGIWRVAGISGWNLIATGSGKDIPEARKIAYRRVRNIQIPHMFYRQDIGLRNIWEINLLRKWGYLPNLDKPNEKLD